MGKRGKQINGKKGKQINEKKGQTNIWGKKDK